MRSTSTIGLFTLIMLLTACVTATDASHAADSQKPPVSAKAVPPPIIEEFGDIPVPRELKRNDDQSFVYEAPGVAIGVITYSGRVTANSVAGFFREQMPTQGWRFLNAFKDSKNIDLFFMKSSRSCQISIRYGILATKVIVKVGPSG